MSACCLLHNTGSNQQSSQSLSSRLITYHMSRSQSLQLQQVHLHNNNRHHRQPQCWYVCKLHNTPHIFNNSRQHKQNCHLSVFTQCCRENLTVRMQFNMSLQPTMSNHSTDMYVHYNKYCRHFHVAFHSAKWFICYSGRVLRSDCIFTFVMRRQCSNVCVWCV